MWPTEKVEKKYLAISFLDECEIKDTGKFEIVSNLQNEDGKVQKARSKVEVLKRKNGFALLEVSIETGRKHQIRKQLASVGMPIVGDDKYGNFAQNREFLVRNKSKRMMLHAKKLRIKSEVVLDCDAPVGNAFNDCMNELF